MLVLSRHDGESITIGDEIKLTVLSIKGKQVRIGIDAPRTISVHREEVYDLIKAEQTKNSAVDSPDAEHSTTDLKSEIRKDAS